MFNSNDKNNEEFIVYCMWALSVLHIHIDKNPRYTEVIKVVTDSDQGSGF